VVSDWSSDVCSSDLHRAGPAHGPRGLYRASCEPDPDRPGRGDPLQRGSGARAAPRAGGRTAISAVRSGDGVRRSGGDPRSRHEPDRQRREVLGHQGQCHGGNRQTGRALCDLASEGSGARDCQIGAGSYFPAILPRAGAAGLAHQGHRLGAIHRALRCQTARGARLGGERRAGTRQHLRAATANRQMSRILVVEDELHLAEGLRFNLEAEGYQVEVVETAEAALEQLLPDAARFDVVVLDVMLPGKDGFTVMRELRQAGQFIPTLMLTARGHAEDILQGFEAGADDYLTKPFELAILIARIGGLLRRRQWLAAAIPAAPAPPVDPGDAFTFGDKSVHFDLLELHVREQVFRLTLMEANLLRFLIQREGKPVPRKSMLEEVGGLHEDTDTRAIDNFIVRLRRYIEPDPTKPRHLLTVRGVGYRFVAAPAGDP